jgi:iron complex outermembrane receptor protein
MKRAERRFSDFPSDMRTGNTAFFLEPDSMRRLQPLFASLMALLPAPSAMMAQDSLVTRRDTMFYILPVIVTATQAHERETPATFSNLTQAQLADRYSVQDVPVLLSELPSMTYYSENGNGIGYNYVNLRGFDQRRLSVMINGVPQNDPEDHNVYWIDFPDLLGSTGSIQVQRGAGSDFYGPPAIGGSINLTTNPFNRRPGITLETDLGFQQFGDSTSSLPLSTRKFEAAVNSGLVANQYMFYGRLGKILSGGYRVNSWVELNSYFLGALRIDNDMTTRLHFFGGPLTDGLAYLGLPKFAGDDLKLRRQNLGGWSLDSTQSGYGYAVARRPQESESFSQPHYELIHEWHLAPGLMLHNTLFFYSGDGYFDYDASWADTSMLRLGYRYGFPTSQNPANALVRAFVGNNQWGWLPRLDIGHGSGTLTVGGELRFHRSTHWGRIQYAERLPDNFDPDYHFYEYNGEKDILSLYGHELYRPDKSATVMIDLQLVRDVYRITNEKFLGNNFSLPYFFANPRVGVNYNFNEEWNGYLSCGYTSREPVLRNLYAAEDSYFGATPQFRADTSHGTVKYDFTQPLAKPERLLDLEAGAVFGNQTAHLSADVFWMEFTDELVAGGQVDIFGQPVTGNAGRTRHTGIELDGSFSPTPLLTLAGNFTYSLNRLVRYSVIDELGFIRQGALVSLDGNPIAGFPDVLANFRITGRDAGMTVSIDARYVGPFYTDNFKNDANRNDAYAVVNAQLLSAPVGVAGVELALRAEVRNVFNKLYFLGGEGNAFFPAAERNFLIGITTNI